MDIKFKYANLDLVLGVIFALSLAVPFIAQNYGLDARLFWIPTVCYVLWALITGIIYPNLFVYDSIEKSIIEKLKGWCYVLTLPITLVANYLILTYAPRTGEYILITLVAVVIYAIPLGYVVRSFPKIFFRQELASMNQTQLKLVNQMLVEFGASSLWISVSLLSINGVFTDLEGYGYLTFVLTFLIAFVFLIVAYTRYRKASKIASSVESELISSQWYKKYSKANAKKPKRRTPKR